MLENIDVLLPIVSGFIPLLTAFSVSPNGSNTVRTLIAVVAAASLAVANSVLEVQAFDLDLMASGFVTAVVSQLSSYKILQGLLGDKDLNEVVGNFGFGHVDVDD